MRRYLDQRLKLRQLRIVAAAATQGSLLKASRTLGLTQPALTKALREVEDVLELRLFDRHARGITANAHGRVLAGAGQRIIDLLRDVEAEFDVIEARAGGQVVVGALPTAAAGIMPEVLHRLSATAPDIQVNVIEDRTDQLMNALKLGDIDLIVGRLYPEMRDDPALLSIALYDEPMGLMVGPHHALAAADLANAAAIAEFALSMPLASLRIHEETRAFLDTYDISAQDGPITTSLTLLRELLLSSDLMTVMPRLMLAGDLKRGTLIALPLDPERTPPPRPSGLIHRGDRPLLPAVRILADVIRDVAVELTGRTGQLD